MQTFFAQHADRLTMHQLPAYSPDYNPIEHLWRNVKRDKTHNTYFPTFESLMVLHETVWGMRQARSPAFWDVPIGVYRMTGDEVKIHTEKQFGHPANPVNILSSHDFPPNRYIKKFKR